MTDPFSNMEESFKNAFEHWEAPHSSAEMNAGWNQVASHLPHVPGSGAHAGSTGHAAGHIAAGAGKVIGFAGLGAAVVATSVILYNIYVKPAKTTPDQISKAPAKTEQTQTAGDQVKKQGQSAVNLNTGKLIIPKRSTSDLSKGKSDISADNGTPQSSANPLFNTPSTPAVGNGSKQNNPTASSNNNPPKPSLQKSTLQGMKLFLSDTVVCVGATVSSSSNVSMSNPNIVIEWGDGNWSYFTGQNFHKYTRAGVFRAHLTLDSFRADRMVTVLKTPKAKFISSQSDNFYVKVDNRSQDASTYLWNFGDGSSDVNGFYANHTYTDSGEYKIQLIAINATGCADTSYQNITVQHLVLPEISRNVITPNGDGKDDDVGVNMEGDYSMELTITDGNTKVFETNDKNIHWTGKNQFTGEDCKAGRYYYTIIYSLRQDGGRKLINGQITLIR